MQFSRLNSISDEFCYPLQLEGVQPFFIVSPYRTGTSLMKKMLVAGNEVHIPPESNDFMPRTMLEHLNVRKLSWINQVEALTQRYSNSLLEQNWGIYVREFKDFLLETPIHQQNLHTKIWSLHKLHAQKYRPAASYVADNTPLLAEWMQWLILASPNSPVIYMYRDLADTVASRMKAFEEDLDVAFERYRNSWQSISRFESKHPGLVLKLRYEELLNDPEKSMRMICTHTGLHFSQTMLAPIETVSRVGLEDNEESEKGLHYSSTIGKGYQQLSDQEIQQLRKWLRKSELPKELIIS